MADTTTPNFVLVKPEVGFSQNSWGSKTNGNWDILDTQIALRSTSAGPTFTGNGSIAGNWAVGGNLTVAGTATITGVTTFTAAPTVPNQAAGDNDTSAANTAFVQAASKIAVPIGAIMAFAMPTPPSGYLECNGISLLRTDWPALFAAIGGYWGVPDGTHFNIPDFRGFFLRGWAHGSGNDITLPSRAFASFQEFSNQDHLHGASASSSTSIAAAGAHAHSVYGRDLTNSYAGPGATWHVMGYEQIGLITATDTQGNHAHGATTTTSVSIGAQDRTGGFAEAKPRNFAVMYCIRAL